MADAFLIALRESFQSALLLAFVFFFPPVADSKKNSRSLVLGVIAAFVAGSSLGFFGKDILTNETWTFWRFIAEAVLFYLSVLFLIRRPHPAPIKITAGLFALGFFLFFFESRALSFLIHDMGHMQERPVAVAAAALAGITAGFLPLVLLRKYLKMPLDQAFNLPSLLMTIGALQLWFGGVAELERENIMVPLQRGLLTLLSGGMQSLQSLLMLTEHPFLDVTAAGLARYLAGDRTALALTVLFLMTPPVFILIHLFAPADPVVSDIAVPAQRRQKVAFFRNELISRSLPVLTVFIVLVILLHAVNVSLNPLYEPAPVPVRPAESNTKAIAIPLADKLGDFTDKKLRKYVYYYGNKQIIFLAILKPDGTVGVALDECEICRPAEWNTDAKGYAQKGEHLICKYCMTPVATSTVNNPGGCNPIPVPFKLDENRITIGLDDLISLYNKVQALEKKGTHL